ncbi:MAG: class B sortase [Faecousia sp.]
MQFQKTVLRAANAIFNFVVISLLVIAGSYSAFALWDNERIYAAAGDVQADMIKLKPEIILSEEEDSGADFSELLKVNPDVCGWLTLDNTNVDYPILQGDTNFTYINTDVYGNFALAGSIFLDTRSNRDFTDPYSLIYGHHMADSKMFGDLDKYKEESFFRENTTGSLILPNKAYHLEIIACLLVNASEDNIFEPTIWRDSNINTLLDYIENNAVNLRGDVHAELRASEGPIQILALSTCSYEFTDARTIVLAAMKPYSPGSR